MKRYISLLIVILLVGGIIFLVRSCGDDKPRKSLFRNEATYRLNERINNSHSTLPETRRMEQYINRWMARYNIRGAALAIMKDEKLIYSKGFGWADKEYGDVAESGSIFRIASASKLITAIGIMRLCDEGKLALDDKVFGPDGILSQFTEFRDKRASQITVLHLLEHTSGFSRIKGDPMFRTTDVMKWEGMTSTPTSDELIAYQLRMRLRCQPGGASQYSNIGYLVLSRVIEQVSGMAYEDYIKQHVLIPAGCYDMHIAGNYYKDRHPNEVKYYGHDPGELIESFDGTGAMRPREYGGNNITGLQGAGAWVASAAELMRLVASIDGEDGVKDILSPKSIERLNGRNDNDGFGWAYIHSGGYRLVRTGTMSGTCAHIEWKRNDYSFVFLTNTSHYRGSTFTKDNISRMVRTALTRVTEWPADRDLFVAVPDTDTAEAEDNAESL